jgi:hypothetical protein
MTWKTTARCFGWVLGIVLACGSCAGLGQQQKAREQIQVLHNQAFADALRGQPEAARDRLLEAERVGNIVGLGPDPLMSRTQMALGALHANNFNDETKAVAYMTDALARNSDAKLPSGMGTPSARRALALARLKAGMPIQAGSAGSEETGPAQASAPSATGTTTATTTDTTPADPTATLAQAPPVREVRPPAANREDELEALLKEPVRTPSAEVPALPTDPSASAEAASPGHSLDCPVPMEAPPGVEIVLRCSARPELPATSLLILNYRPAGTEAFSQLAMSRTPSGAFEVVVPASATSGKSLQFFVETRGGPVRARLGSQESPNILIVREGAPRIGEPAAVAEARPRGEPSGGSLTSSNREENPLERIKAQRVLANLPRRAQGKFWVSLGVGTGYGWQPGGRLEFRREREIAAGALPGGLLHLMPEFGYQLLDKLSLSVQGRLQYAPTDGTDDPVRGKPAARASAVLARAAYTVGAGPLQGLASVCFGGGDGFRLRVPRDRGLQLARSDTVRGGPLVVGAGAGVIYHFSRHFSVPFETRLLYGFPSSAVVVELGASLAYTF